jgi:hypothetical protein
MAQIGFRNWSLAKVLRLSGGWILLCVLTPLAWLLFQFNNAFDASSGSGGVGVVFFGFNTLMLAIPIVPPVILIVAWLVARWS